MKHSGYTPGPWRVDRAPSVLYVRQGIRASQESPIAVLHVKARSEKDAALIADAPRLAEAEAELGRSLTVLREENERLRAALEAVLDEAEMATADHDHDESESCFTCNIPVIARAALVATKG